jgi:hypothetical protein
MALVLQNDMGSVPNANAYIDVAFFKAYHDDRGNDYGTPTDDVLAQKIIIGTDYVDTRFRYIGSRLIGRQQATEWPRQSAYDLDRYAVIGIPMEVKEATAEYALRALKGDINPDPIRDESGATIQSKSEQVGPIQESVTYVGGATVTMPKYPAADQKLRKAGLVLNGGTLLRA